MGARVMILAGGTGGHVYPALAVAEELRTQDHTVTWMGTRAGLEARVVPEAGIAMEWLAVAGVRGKGWASRWKAPFMLVRACFQAWRILRRVRPAVVLGMGGFVSGPGGLMAKLMGIPLVLHEQNRVPGTTNRWLARWASVVLEAFPGSFPVIVGARCTGNPLRREIAVLWEQTSVRELAGKTDSESRGLVTVQTPPPSGGRLGGGRDGKLRQYQDSPSPQPPPAGSGSERLRRLKSDPTEALHILVLGGSQGARALNETVPLALAKVQAPIRVLHQTGEAMRAATEEAYRQAGVEARVEAFVRDMAEIYRWADLAVCRAGAMTVSELAAAGVPAILVPYPFAIDDHQTANARFLAEAGAAILLPQQEMDADSLATRLSDLANDPARLRQFAERCRSLARPEAARRVAEICLTEAGRCC